MTKLIQKKDNKDDGILMDEDLASMAGLTICGSDNEGNTEYIGTDKEWQEYERLETEELIDEKIEQEQFEDEDYNENSGD